MKTANPKISFRSITRNLVQAVLYALAFHLSFQVPVQNFNQIQEGQFAFEKQNYCLVPIEEQNTRSVNNSIKLLPVIVLPLPEFLKEFNYRAPFINAPSRTKFSTIIYSAEEIIITMRRLRI